MIKLECEKILDEKQVSEYQLKILKNVKNDFLIIPKLKKENDMYKFLFTKENVENLYRKLNDEKNNKKIYCEVLNKFLSAIKEVVIFIDDMMLEIDNLVLDLQYIYLDAEYNFYFIYVPLKENTNSKNKEFFLELLGILNTRKIIKNKKVINLQDKLKKESELNLKTYILIADKLDKLIKDENKNTINVTFLMILIMVTMGIIFSIIKQKMFYDYFILIFILIYILLMYQILKDKSNKCKEEKALKEMNTKIINRKVYLEEKPFKIKHYMTNDKFLIGKAENCDLKLNNVTVSTEHALIFKQNNNWCIRDLKSKNHTYLNEIILKEDENIRLKNSDEIRICNKKYVFKDVE